MCRADLAFKDLISYHHIPVALEDDRMELRPWPMILPESMVLASLANDFFSSLHDSSYKFVTTAPFLQ
jgi:hypothetical protein